MQELIDFLQAKADDSIRLKVHIGTPEPDSLDELVLKSVEKEIGYYAHIIGIMEAYDTYIIKPKTILKKAQ
ncbi:MAG TPA: hypothetical protein VFM69_06370 [Pricia sp.]|nr:hypothetical protein [Pricia sp.]